MARYPQFQVKRVPGKSTRRWQLTIPATQSETRQRRRLYFKTREKAMAERDRRRAEKEQFGRRALHCDPGLRAEALKATEILKPLGATITEAVREFVERRERANASRPFGELFAEIAEQKQLTRSENYAISFRKSCARLTPHFSQRPISEITADELRDALSREAGNSASQFNALRAHASVVWGVAAKRGWAPKNLTGAVDKMERRAAPIRTLTVEELRTLLATAEIESPDCVIPIALQAFAGVRTEELRRLRWDCLDLEEGEMALDESITKTNHYRVVSLQPNLLAWIRRYAPAKAHRWGPLIPADWKRKATRIRNRAGWAVVDLKTKDSAAAQPPAEAPAWPTNALRKSFGSAHLKAFGSLDTTITEMGHHGDPRTFWRFYHRGYSRREALAYWQSGPGGEEIKFTVAA